MDLVTQGVLGAAIGEAGFRKQLGDKAVMVGALAGMLPDADIVSGFFGQWQSLIHHRGFTHSIFFAPLVAPLLGYLAWRWAKREGPVQQWMHLVFWALLTHPLLDLFTTYGTQLLTPFSSQRFALDGISIVDPIYTIPLVLALLIAKRTKENPDIGRRVTAGALVLTTVYLGIGTLISQQTIRTSRQQLQPNFQPVAIRATPTIFNVLLWRVLARDKNGDIKVGMHSTLHPRPILFHDLKHLDSPLLRKAMNSRKGKLLDWFADGYLSVEVLKHPKGTELIFHDQRFASLSAPTRSFFKATASFDKKGKLFRFVRQQRDPRDVDFKKDFSLLWKMMTKGAPTPQPKAAKRKKQGKGV